jgi:hypothetical protein
MQQPGQGGGMGGWVQGGGAGSEGAGQGGNLMGTLGVGAGAGGIQQVVFGGNGRRNWGFLGSGPVGMKFGQGT